YLIEIFLFPVMLFGAVAGFVFRYWILQEKLSQCLVDSLILLILGILLFSFSRVIKNEDLKSNLFSVILALFQIFLIFRLYYLIGPTIWTACFILIIISMLRMKKTMMIILLTTTIFMVVYNVITKMPFQMNLVYHISQIISITVFSLVVTSIYSIIANKFNKIYEQFHIINLDKKKYQLTLQSVGDGIISIDRNGNVDFMNPIAQQLTGWNIKDAYGKPFELVFDIVNEFTREKIENPVKKVFETKKIIELANHTVLISKNGSEKPVEDTAAPILDDFDNVIGVVLVFRDYSEKKEKRKQIEYVSYHDPLTGLYNRRFFDEELRRIDTIRNLPISVIYADINGLKTINDAFGHHHGDFLIKTFAEIIKKECRGDDIIARTGGDEFILLLPKTESEFAEKLIERIQDKIAKERVMSVNISASFGYETKTDLSEDSDTIIRKAEDNMYHKKIREKSDGNNSVVFSILNSLYIKCPHENNHSKNVSVLCEQIGRACSLSEKDINDLKTAGEFHDIGKIAVDKHILHKKGELEISEWEQLKHHPETGFRLLTTTNEFYHIADYILSHHERWDGEGYPRRLKGDEINFMSRIIFIADSYDDMISDHVYRKALTKEEAAHEIRINAGKKYDPVLSRIFIEKVLGDKF
ncbi:MAG: diguanylate cyclase, partial [Clostridia bacterium]|nr:diguanylate cyclase [Clostridia bacterium]